MNLIDKKVRHNKFGIGAIVSQTMTTVTVQFCEEYGAKKFLCPAAFESFLALCDLDAKAQMDDELRQALERAEEERRKRAEEEGKRRALIEQKRAAAKKNGLLPERHRLSQRSSRRIRR